MCRCTKSGVTLYHDNNFVPFQYRGLAPMYYRGAVAVIVAYDITDEVTMAIDHILYHECYQIENV